jgi:hypothetical protein
LFGLKEIQGVMAAAFSGMKLQDKSYAPVIGLIWQFTLWTLFYYLLPGHLFNDSLTIL